MKRILILLVFVLGLSHITSAQTETSFGIKGGLNLTFFNVSEANFGENTETAIGYFGGIYLDIDFGKDLHIQPEVLYIGLNDFKFINTPIYLNYSVNEQLDVLVGPSLNYFFDFFNNKFKVRADLGLAYNLKKLFSAQVKYTIGFEEITPNGLFLGIGYKCL